MQSTSFSKSLISGAKTLFSGSEPNYYLEHQVSSRFHNQGEKQAIILEEITLGRASDCNVRFDESFSHVSRYHARILRKDNKWTLVHLSSTNKTFLNGKPVDGEWFLQDGDEIQLADNGPKLIFRLPVQPAPGGKSEFGMTARFDQFKQQVVRPYRTWLWIISCLLVLLIGWGVWQTIATYKIRTEIENLKGEVAVMGTTLDSVKDSLAMMNESWEVAQKQINDYINSNKIEMAKLKSSNAKNQKKNKEMQAKLDTLEWVSAQIVIELVYMQKQEQELLAQNEILKARLDDNDANIKEIKNKIAQNEESLVQLRKDMKGLNRDINYYRDCTFVVGNALGPGSHIRTK